MTASSTNATPKHARADSAIAWLALHRAANRHIDRDLLEDGSAHQLAASLMFELPGRTWQERIDGKLTVGHATTATSSQGPPVEHLVAVLLSKLNAPTRERLMAWLPKVFADLGTIPANTADIAKAKGLLSRMRQTRVSERRGTVAFAGEHTLVTGSLD